MQVLNRMSMDTTLKLIKTCLIPSLLYGAEAWILNKSELSTLERTVTQILRLTLQVPTSTPSVARTIHGPRHYAHRRDY